MNELMNEFLDLDESNDFYVGYYKAKLDAVKAILASKEIKYSDSKLGAISAILEVKLCQED